MSRLTRDIKDRVRRIDAHHAVLRGQVYRFNADLGERAAKPPWLIAAFGAGLAGGLLRGGRKEPEMADTAEAAEKPGGGSAMTTLIRQIGVPVAISLLQQYLSPQGPAGEEPEPPPE